MRYAPRALLAGGLWLRRLVPRRLRRRLRPALSRPGLEPQRQLEPGSDAVASGQCGAATSAADGLAATRSGNLGGVNAQLTAEPPAGRRARSSVLAHGQCTSSTSTTTTSTSTTSTTTSTHDLEPPPRPRARRPPRLRPRRRLQPAPPPRVPLPGSGGRRIGGGRRRRQRRATAAASGNGNGQ